MKRRVAEYEEEMRKERKEYVLTDAEVAEVAKQFWDRAMKHLYQYDKLRVAKIYIKLLYKKYPQLMDEPL